MSIVFMSRSGFFLIFCLLLSLSSFIWGGPTLLFDVNSFVVANIRLPRMVLAFIAGASLGIVGLFFQALFRNPLASPYTLGSASSASLGATFALFFLNEVSFLSSIPIVTALSFVFSLLSVFFIYSIWKFSRKRSVNDLLLCGVILSFISSSGVLLIQSLSPSQTVTQIALWMMGGIDVLGWEKPSIIFFVLVLSLLIYRRFLSQMDLVSHSQKVTLSRGIDLDRLYRNILLTSSLLIAVTVSFTGPIGFVGLLAPHISRKLFGAKTSSNFWPVLIIGGSLVALSDALLRFIFPERFIPVGVMTSFLGGIFFLYLLLKKET